MWHLHITCLFALLVLPLVDGYLSGCELRSELSISLGKHQGIPWMKHTPFFYDARVALNLPASHAELMLKLKKGL